MSCRIAATRISSTTPPSYSPIPSFCRTNRRRQPRGGFENNPGGLTGNSVKVLGVVAGRLPPHTPHCHLRIGQRSPSMLGFSSRPWCARLSRMNQFQGRTAGGNELQKSIERTADRISRKTLRRRAINPANHLRLRVNDRVFTRAKSTCQRLRFEGSMSPKPVPKKLPMFLSQCLD